MKVNWGAYGVTPEHLKLVERFVGSLERVPDLIITGGEPVAKAYLYRWHVTPRSYDANVYFHMQTGNDPERPLHDHPWDNQSVILANGYDELYQARPPRGETFFMPRRAGQTVHRKATDAHRLLLPPQFKYSLSLFTTGPAIRDERGWGFWIENTWYSHKQCTITLPNNRTLFTYPDRQEHAA